MGIDRLVDTQQLPPQDLYRQLSQAHSVESAAVYLLGLSGVCGLLSWRGRGWWRRVKVEGAVGWDDYGDLGHSSEPGRRFACFIGFYRLVWVNDVRVLEPMQMITVGGVGSRFANQALALIVQRFVTLRQAIRRYALVLAPLDGQAALIFFQQYQRHAMRVGNRQLLAVGVLH